MKWKTEVDFHRTRKTGESIGLAIITTFAQSEASRAVSPFYTFLWREHSLR